LLFINIVYILGLFLENITASFILLNICKVKFEKFLKYCYQKEHILLTNMKLVVTLY
jgi:hypothetical protein